MCRQDSQAHSSSENAVAAEESLSIYCKPVELYNILERRAVQNPSFLQRCLRYKIQEKRKRRIKMTISLSSSMIRGAQVQRMLPLYVLLVTPFPEVGAGRHSAAYCCRTEECMLFSSSDFERRDCIKANFVLPEMKTLYDEFKSGKLSVLLISRGVKRNSFLGGNLVSGQMDASSSPAKVGGYCLWGKIPMESLFSSWDKYVSLSTGHGAELFSTVDMRPSFLESKSLEKEQCITIKTPDNPVAMQLRVNIFAQEVGAKERSPYCPLTQNSVHNSSSPHIMRMRNGNVVFNYKYYNNTLQKTEVTEDFSCPFCLAKCASFKGLRYHLCASHDLFNFDFWVTEEYQAVNVSVRDEVSRSEIVTNGVDPKLETFFLCLKPLSRTLSRIPSRANYVHTCIQKSGSPDTVRNALLQGILGKQAGASSFVMPTTSPIDAEPSNQLSLHIHENDARSSKLRDKTPKAFLNENDTWNSSNTVESNGAVDASVVECLECVASSPNVMGISAATAQSSVDPECLPLSSGSNLGPSAILQFAKTRKLSAERSDPRNHVLLQKRQFFHSHRAQPMELEQVMSDRDSEDEVDDDIVDFEDRRMLDDFVDVTKDEKKIMNLWNSFVRKQRVLADGHVPWACEAFSRLHGRDLVQAPALLWCWRLFMIKLWNHGLLDSTTMNECSHILFRYKIENSRPKLS